MTPTDLYLCTGPQKTQPRLIETLARLDLRIRSPPSRKKKSDFCLRVSGTDASACIHCRTAEKSNSCTPQAAQDTGKVTAGYQRTKICPNPSVNSARRIRVHLPEEKWKSSSCLQDCRRIARYKGHVKISKFPLENSEGTSSSGLEVHLHVGKCMKLLNSLRD